MQIYKYTTVVSHACFALRCFVLLRELEAKQSQRQLSFGKGAKQCKYISMQLSSVTLRTGKAFAFQSLFCKQQGFALLCLTQQSKAKPRRQSQRKLSLGKGQQRRSKKIES